jgi:leucyl-tRNA synthetase
LYVRFWTKALKDLGYINIEEPAQKLINQGMIQGRSNFVYRLDFTSLSKDAFKGISVFVSKDLLDEMIKDRKSSAFINFSKKIKEEFNIDIKEDTNFSFSKLNVDVNIVENDILDKEKFLFWRPEIKDALLMLNKQGNYICSWEIEKMSKSKFNIVSPDDICEKFGADTLRLYEMFLGPLEQSKPWNTNGITGVSGFLKKLWRLFFQGGSLTISDEPATKAELKTLHTTIKKITEDIERFSFNTSVSNFMICVNELTEQKCNKREVLEPLITLISPYAPHITEELWSLLGHAESVSTVPFPEFNPAFLVEDNFNYPVSFNGKMRFNLELPTTLSPAEIEKIVLEHENSQKYLEGKAPKKVIIVPKKIVNIVV